MSSPVDDLAIPDSMQDVEHAVIGKEKVRTLYRCLSSLSFLDKTLVSLYLEDMSYQEIAFVAGIR